MSEKTETVEKKAPAKPRPKGERDGGSPGAFLAMLIALGAAGGSYYIWQQHLVAEQDRQALAGGIEELLKVVEQRDQALQARIEQLKAHRHEEAERRLAALEQSLPELSHRLSVQQQEWGLAEVDYLLRTAEQRLQLHRDIPTALTALGQAREQLTNYANGDFGEVIAAIDQHITELSQQKPDGGARLSALIAGSEGLPLAPVTAGEVVASPAPQPLAEGAEFADKMKYWGKVVWHDLMSLVTIRKTEDRQPSITGQQQRQLLHGHLALKLESARLAAQQYNQSLYATTLAEAKGLLERRFDGSDAAVQGAIATLDALAAIPLDAPLPSLSVLRQQLHAAQAASRLEAPQAEPPFTDPAAGEPQP